LQEDGRYAEAGAAYERVLQDFPKDRAAWRNLGRVLYLDGKYEQALKALDETLAIDGEDRVAHYHKMLCLRALGRAEEARVAEAAYEVYKIDESAQELTLAHRLAHQGDNRESQRIHRHELLTPAQVAAGVRPGNTGCCGEAMALAKESTVDEQP
jgi:tetratricopeptide (TPR) repeat protein